MKKDVKRKKNIVCGFCVLVLSALLIMLNACSEDTGTLGISSSNDALKTSMKVCSVYSKTVKLDSIQARSTFTYVGSIYDPETKGKLTGNCLTQLSVMEGMDYFPHPDSITSLDKSGRPCCDTVFLQFNFDRYYGDVNTPIKLAVYPLDMKRPLCEDSIYYIDTDLRKFIRPGYEDKPIATKVFTAWDRIYGTDPSNSTSSSYPSIRVPLPLSEGNNIMEKYWEYLKDNKGLDVEEHVNRNFDDSYHFIRNVLPGYYAEVINGEGVIVRVFVDALYLIYKARMQNEGKVEEMSAYSVFAGTPEVVQGCRFTQSDANEMVKDEEVTWLKTPAGLCTEVELPIDEIYDEEHSKDSISRVELMFTRYNKEQTGNQFDIPQRLLLVRKAEVKNFFREGKLPNSVTSFLAAFQSAYNTYSFSNIAQLITYLHQERETAVALYVKNTLGIENPTEAQLKDVREEWTRQNPDWNKCCVVPVEVSTNTSTNAVTSVKHELDLTSAKLVRGTQQNPIRIQVYYTRVASASDM